MPLQIAPGMMVGVADNEQPDRQQPPAPPPAPVDPEQQRQFEQFQQFQQFLKFQETQGQGQIGGSAGQAQGPKQRPVWLKILLSKGFRYAVLLAIVIAAVAWGCGVLRETFNIAPKDDGLGVQGGAGPGEPSSPGKPNEILDTLYRSISVGQAKTACSSFDKEGQAAFARNYGAPDCIAAVVKLQGEVAALTSVPRIETPDSPQVFEVSSCTLAVKPGTTSLGRFTIRPFDKLWIISGQQPETCPTATSPPSTSTRR